MTTSNISLKNFFWVLFPLVLATFHEICFFSFLWVNEGLSQAIRINMSFAKWWHFVKNTNSGYYFFCWLLPVVISFVITYVVLKVMMKKNEVH